MGAPESPTFLPRSVLRGTVMDFQEPHEVCIVTQAIYPDIVGGAPIACHELGNALARTGTSVEIHTVDYRRSPDGEPPGEVWYAVRRHRKVPLPWDLIGAAGNPLAPSLYRAVRDSSAPVVHLRSHLFWTSVLGAWAARRSGKAVLLSVHGVRAVRGRFINFLQEVWLRTFSHGLFRSADLIVCLSQRDAAEVQRYGADPRRIRILFNGYNETAFHPDGEAAGEQVVWVGRHVEEKGIQFLLDAWPQVLARRPEARLLLVGDGPTRPDAERQAERLGVTGSVRFLGFQAPSAVGELLRASRVFVLPSLQEGFPIALAEAMACGLPSVTTEGLEEIVGDGGVGVPARDPVALARAVAGLLADPVRSRRMGEAAALRARARYTWGAAAAAYHAAYVEAIEERQKRRKASRAR